MLLVGIFIICIFIIIFYQIIWSCFSITCKKCSKRIWSSYSICPHCHDDPRAEYKVSTQLCQIGKDFLKSPEGIRTIFNIIKYFRK